VEEFERYGSCLKDYTIARLDRNGEYAGIIQAAKQFIQARRDIERLRPPGFTVFDALRLTYDEAAHSSLLAYLFDPAQQHDQGVFFLQKFLALVQEMANLQGKDLEIKLPLDCLDWSCRREVTLPEPLGRVDILLRGPDFIGIIENKILAGDQQEQLARYWKFLKAEPRIPDKNKVIVYLTLDGRAPTGETAKNDQELIKHLVLLSIQR